MRYHEMKKEWGFARLLPLETFKNSNRYLADDSFMFGVEAFVLNYTGYWESVSVLDKKQWVCFTWEIKNFSKLNESCYRSEQFYVGGVFWYVSTS